MAEMIESGLLGKNQTTETRRTQSNNIVYFLCALCVSVVNIPSWKNK